MEDDTALIEKIEVASKTTVSVSDLPASTASTFEGDLADVFINEVELAAGLGYKVAVGTDDLSRLENTSDVYFSTTGRLLNDTEERRVKRRNRCFEFVFPIDFIMPDDSVITLETKADWVLIRQWYRNNAGVTVRPELVFPVDIILKEDNSTQTLIDRDDLFEVKQNCRANRDKRKCFQLVLPVSFTMPDNTEITVNTRADFRLLRQWHKDNPDVTGRGTLNFPVDIEYRDGTTETIADAAAYAAARVSCR